MGAGCRRFVDGVDDADVGILLQEVLHGGAPAFLGAGGHVVADDARVVLVTDLLGILDVDAEALHEALVAQNVDGRLAGIEVHIGDLGGVAEINAKTFQKALIAGNVDRDLVHVQIQ